MMLLDSASMYFRAFFGVPDSVTAPDGSPVNAVRGFLDMIAYLVGTHRPTHLVACMDADWRPAWRVSAVPAYKAQRLAPGSGHIEIVPPALEAQIPVIEDVLDALGLTRIGAAGYEADDVIGTLAAHASMPVDVVSGDRDLFQVVNDDRSVQVLYIGRGVRKLEVMDDAAIRRKYGIPASGYADFALLRGDPSDGLVGVAGIGEKTAASLIDGYGSVPGLLAALDNPGSGLAPGIRMKLNAARDYLVAAQPVVRVATDVEIPDHDATLPAGPVDPPGLVALSERWGLDGSLNRVLAALKP